MAPVLILGGTAEANALAHALAGREVVTSLAGRTGTVPDLPGSVRVGGFGGTDGLALYLRHNGIGAVVDATHPFAARISAHAAEACRRLGIPRLVLSRPPWPRQPGDIWIAAASMADAAAQAPAIGRRALLTVGVQEAAAFAGIRDVWFLVRVIAARDLPLDDYQILAGRGPFTIDQEIALMRRHRIDMVVTKASGGSATYAKIAAARALGLPVVMVSRPPPPEGDTVSTIDEAVRWLLSRPQDVGVVGGVEP